MQSRNRYVCMRVCKGGEYEGNRTSIDKWRSAGWVGRVVVGGWLMIGATDRSSGKEEVGRVG